MFIERTQYIIDIWDQNHRTSKSIPMDRDKCRTMHKQPNRKIDRLFNFLYSTTRKIYRLTSQLYKIAKTINDTFSWFCWSIRLIDLLSANITKFHLAVSESSCDARIEHELVYPILFCMLRSYDTLYRCRQLFTPHLIDWFSCFMSCKMLVMFFLMRQNLKVIKVSKKEIAEFFITQKFTTDNF